MKSTIGGVRVSVRLIRRLSRFSTAQQYSPIRSAPTMRPLPLSVWNDRRTVMSNSMSSGESAHEGRCRLIEAISSFASSMNSSRSSGSMCSASGDTTGSGMTSVDCMACVSVGACAVAAAACAAISSVDRRIVWPSDSPSTASCVSRCSTSRSTARHASALSSMYHGSLRPALTVSM